MKRKLMAMLLAVSMCVTMMPDTGLTVSAEQEGENHAPVLKEGVSPTAEGQVKVGSAYLLSALQKGQIFTDPDGDKLTYQSYYYERSTDEGETWGPKQGFSAAMFGATTICLTENEPGVYKYRFYAYDGKDYSEETWELTLNVVEHGIWETAFYVSQDQNYKTNGNRYPEIDLYYTAGVDSETGHDYVGWYEKDGEEEYVFNPAEYTIEGDEEAGWGIMVDGEYYDLNDYHPLEFTDSSFGKETEEEPTESGTIVSNYNMFYANVDASINEQISYRGYGYADADEEEPSVYLGGMTLSIPLDQNVDGAASGGNNIYLRTMSIGAMGQGNIYFDENDYVADINCPIMKCHPQSGDPFLNGKYTNYPFMVYAGGNACLYTYLAKPVDDSFFQAFQINRTIQPGTSYYGATNLTCKKTILYEVEVPSDTDFALYFQWNNFNTQKWATEESKKSDVEYTDNGDTKTYTYRIGSGDWTYRLTDKNGEYVTKSGWVSVPTSDTKVTYNFENGHTDKKTQDRSGLGSTVINRDEADLMVNLDPTGFEKVGEDDSVRVRSYRFWEIINSDVGNIMVEPDFHYQLLQGSLETDLQDSVVNGGNASENWVDLDPDGTAVLAVNYDALDVSGSNTHGGLFPATNPKRTGVFIISDNAEDAGTASAVVKYNKAEGFTSTRSADWDYNFDTWYYSTDDEEPTLDFTVEQGESDLQKVEYAVVTTNDELKSTMSSYEALEADEDGAYHVDLNVFREKKTDTTPYSGGTVIIRMQDASGYSYRLVRVAEQKTTVVNADNSKNTTETINGKETKVASVINPGDTVNISFDGMFRAVNKISGIFNPTTYNMRYTKEDGTENVSANLGQYQALNRIQYTFKVPEDVEFDSHGMTTTYTLTNGYVFGSMYSAANPFAFLYTMTDTGVGTNFNAVTVSYTMHHLADIDLTLTRNETYDLKFDVSDESGNDLDATIVLKNSAGETKTGENGIYKNLKYGTYSYEIGCKGYYSAVGTIDLEASTEQAEDGRVHETVVLKKLAEGAWDGVTTTEPQTDEAGTYQISNGAELAWFAEQVNNGQSTLNAVLTADIDLAENLWTPIGKTGAYKGAFDGQNHIISGLKVKTETMRAGLFGYTDRPAKICNLTVDGVVTLESKTRLDSAYAAGIVGYAYYADLENLTNKATVKVTTTTGNAEYTGGVAGCLTQGGIKNCTNEGNVNGVRTVGGVVGQLNLNAKMTNCSNHGAVYASNSRLGGVIGSIASTATNCYNTGTVTSGLTTKGNSYAGGIAGYVEWGPTLKNCFNAGKVTANVGGGAVIGYVDYMPKTSNLYYLEGTASYVNSGSGSYLNKVAATSMTADEMADAMFVMTLNGNSGEEEALFGTGESWPMFIREGGQKLAVETGDVNGDGQIDKADADALYVIVKTKTTDDLSKMQILIMDLNKDGKVDSKDVSLLYAYAAGKISSFN